MSAIKISGLKIFFPVFLLLIFSCSKSSDSKDKTTSEETLEYVIFSKVGGDEGNYKTIKITQDSILLDVGKTSKNIHRSWKMPLTENGKKQLFSIFKINQLPFIKSSESRQATDGTDETFQIKTSRTSYVFVNAYNDEYNYRQLKNFKTQLEKLIPKEFKPL